MIISKTTDYIVLATENGSIAEISHISGNLWYFNRIKSKSTGDGTKLMTELVKLLDEKGIILECAVSPYGAMSLSRLISFYKSFGFEIKEVNEEEGTALMIRSIS